MQKNVFKRAIPFRTKSGTIETDNAFVESFNGKFRAECLNTAWFLSLVGAQAKGKAWRRDYNYNEVRPHRSIGHQTPAELSFASGQACLA